MSMFMAVSAQYINTCNTILQKLRNTQYKNLHNFVYKQQLSRCTVRMNDTPMDTTMARLS